MIARRALVAGAVLAVFAFPSSAQAVTHDEIMSVLNAERTANGLPALTEDPALSAGCAAHNNYAMQNGSPQTTYFFRDEDPMLPGYTPEGDEASHNSQFSVGSRPIDSFANGNPFDTAPMHLFNLMEPVRKTVGVDQLDFDGGAFGTISLVCIDIRSAPIRPKPKRRLKAYAYLGPDGSTPDQDVIYEEGPEAGSPSGPWIFIYLTVPRRTTLTLRKLTIEDADGNAVQPADQFVSGGLREAGSGRKLPRNVVKGFGSRVPSLGFRLTNHNQVDIHPRDPGGTGIVVGGNVESGNNHVAVEVGVASGEPITIVARR